MSRRPNLYGPRFRWGFVGGSFNRCPHGSTGRAYPCWRCGIWHPVKWLGDLTEQVREGGPE